LILLKFERVFVIYNYLHFVKFKVNGVEVLMLGDSTGVITVYSFEGRSWHICDGSLECHSTSRYKISSGVRNGVCSMTRFKLHADHVTRVAFVSELSCMVSSSLDGSIKVRVALGRPLHMNMILFCAVVTEHIF
jgi:hypothetical protein